MKIWENLTNKQMETFIQTRLDPILTQEGSYYGTILDPDKNSMKQKKVRDSFVIFRSSSTAGALEGKQSMPSHTVMYVK